MGDNPLPTNPGGGSIADEARLVRSEEDVLTIGSRDGCTSYRNREGVLIGRCAYEAEHLGQYPKTVWYLAPRAPNQPRMIVFSGELAMLEPHAEDLLEALVQSLSLSAP